MTRDQTAPDQQPAPEDRHRDDEQHRGDGGCDVAGVRGGGRVWLTAQRSPAAQRAGLFAPESIAHPARMGPDLAGHIIARYSRPGEWVLDPMCGIGTTVVQAVRAGRRAVGVEYEPRWLAIARANLALARDAGYTSTAHLFGGDARRLQTLLSSARFLDVVGRVALVLTSPPYGRGVHGHLDRRPHPDRPDGPGSSAGPGRSGEPGGGGRIVKRHHRYTAAPSGGANLAHATPRGLADGMIAILVQAAAVLRPGGLVVMVVRPWREHGVLVDLPEQMMACAHRAGLTVVDRAVALHGRIDEQTGTSAEFVARQSFFQSVNITRSRSSGAPTHLLAHEDIVIAQKLRFPGRLAATGNTETGSGGAA
jgi:tRNA G10  N-methylase Trm11